MTWARSNSPFAGTASPRIVAQRSHPPRRVRNLRRQRAFPPLPGERAGVRADNENTKHQTSETLQAPSFNNALETWCLERL